VTIPGSVAIISYSAFDACSGLTNVTIGNGVNNISSHAFQECTDLTTVTIPSSVTNVSDWAFSDCTSLSQVLFQGNAPMVDGALGSVNNLVFQPQFLPPWVGTVYYLPGTTGWDTTFGGWPTAMWYLPQPQILGSSYGLGVSSNGFQFTISWATNTAVVVEASANLLNWTSVSTNTLVSGTSAFVDPLWTNSPQQFYRVRPQ